MKSVLISIRPEWVNKIITGEKTLEIRNTRPNLKTPFKCYIYRTKGFEKRFITGNQLMGGKWWNIPVDGAVIGEFVCDKIDGITLIDTPVMEYIQVNGKASMTVTMDACMDIDAFSKYADGKQLYGWNISDLKIYDTPKELCELRESIDCHRGRQHEDCIGCWDCEIKRPPQSWCYVEELGNG